MKRCLLAVSAAILLLYGLASCSRREEASTSEKPSGELIVFHAGSLSVPFKEIAAAFEKEYPGVKVVREAAGSRTCARKISDLHKPCDVMASADYAVIENLLIPRYADWCIRFVNNEMALVYGDKSRRAAEINAANWHELLCDKNVAFGRSNPNLDPCGYRAVLTMKLAENHYHVEGLAARLLAKDTKHIRPKETDLLALLGAGEIDYIFLYRSVAEQHGLKYLVLPDEINLKTPKHAALYSSVTVDISGKEPGTTITTRGEPMIYGITIPASAPNRKAALAFVGFLLAPDKGMAIMARNGQGSVVPSPTASYETVPETLKEFVQRPE